MNPNILALRLDEAPPKRQRGRPRRERAPHEGDPAPTEPARTELLAHYDRESAQSKLAVRYSVHDLLGFDVEPSRARQCWASVAAEKAKR